MSSILDRIAALTKAAVHEGLNRLEDPVMMTGQYLRDLDDRIAAAEQRSRDLQTAGKLLERRLKEYRMLAELSEADAVKALERGDEAAAKAALEAKLRYETSSQECAGGLEETRQAVAGLTYEISAARQEQARLKAKRAELAERAEKARKAAELAKPASGHAGIPGVPAPFLDTSFASRGFERMEEKIREWEAGTADQSRYVPDDTLAESEVPGSVRERAAEELKRLRDQVKNGLPRKPKDNGEQN